MDKTLWRQCHMLLLELWMLEYTQASFLYVGWINFL